MRACRPVGFSCEPKQRLLISTGQLASISYSPFADSEHPDTGDTPDRRANPRRPQGHRPLYPRHPDLFVDRRRRAGPADRRRIRPQGHGRAPGSARTRQRNEREIRSALDLARHNSNVNAIVVGNETILRGEMTVDELIKLIKQVKQSSPVPVTTGEIWTVWLEHPELASAVDFVAAHVLPYWEGFDGLARRRPHHRILRQAAAGAPRQAHRDRRIRLAERRLQFPQRQSRPHRAGHRAARFRLAARRPTASITTSSRRSISRGRRSKAASVPIGAFSTPRVQPKFSWTGPISDPDYIKRAGLAVLLGLLLSLPILAHGRGDRHARR